MDEVGQYGGVLRRAFLGPSDHNNYTRVVYDALVRFSPTGSEVIPHIAAGWESNADFSEWTVRLRPGAKCLMALPLPQMTLCSGTMTFS